MLNETTCPTMRDAHNDYVSLERFFGYLTQGMAFGESALMNIYEQKTRFYNAIAMSETIILRISRRDYAKVVHTHAKKSLNEKIAFLKTIPDLNGAGIPRNKLTTICLNLFTIQKIKSHILFREGEPCKYLYFIKSGEIQI